MDAAIRYPATDSTRQIRPADIKKTSSAPTSAAAKIPEKAFSNQVDARNHLDGAIREMSETAKKNHALNIKTQDQAFPVEVIRMTPPSAKAPPVLIMGGMGPLAGAQAMQAALDKFGDSREIVLLQLCDTPDRTAALNRDRECKGTSPEHHQVVDRLAEGFAVAQGHLSTTHLGDGHALVACNTAHNFVPESFAKFQEKSGVHNVKIESDSLVRCVTGNLKGETRPVLLLGTDGTRKTNLYTKPLTEAGVACINMEGEARKTPDSGYDLDTEMGLLMSAIYDGVKAFKPDVALERGKQLFNKLWENNRIGDQGCVILSACTEVPEIMTLLKGDKSSDSIAAKLQNFEIKDPVAIALNHIETVDAERAAKRTSTNAVITPGQIV